MKHYQGIALVTGASSGIGASFARALRARGYRVALVARRRERLETLARELSGECLVIAADLATDDGREAVVRALADQPVGILVNAAGFGCFGPFEGIARERQAAMVQLNALAVSDLTHRLLPGMIERRSGAVIIVASIAAFQGGPWLAAYAATKAYTLSFAEALWCELRPLGVDVLALCPGVTRSEFKEVAGIDAEPPEWMWADAAEVADSALDAVGRRPVLVHGRLNRLGVLVSRMLPRRLACALSGGVMQRSSSWLRSQLERRQRGTGPADG